MQNMQETRVHSLDQKDPLEKKMATHSSILAWKNPLDRGAWWATVHGGGKASDMTEHRQVLEEIIEGYILFPHGGGNFRSCLSM